MKHRFTGSIEEYNARTNIWAKRFFHASHYHRGRDRWDSTRACYYSNYRKSRVLEQAPLDIPNPFKLDIE